MVRMMTECCKNGGVVSWLGEGNGSQNKGRKRVFAEKKKHSLAEMLKMVRIF